MLLDAGCVVCSALPGPVCAGCASKLGAAHELTVAGVDVCRAGFVLDERARTIVAALKYRRQRRLARWFAAEIAHLLPRGADVITWLPATPERRRTRGFDQAEQLAKALARVTDVPARQLLDRDRSDQRQTGQSRADRLGGPSLSPRRLSPGFVVLIDDVITTGSSLRVGAQVLRGAGAQRIVGLATAVTPLRYSHETSGLRRLSPSLDE